MSQFGWISMHRKIQEHWVWSDASYFKAWAAILLNVNHTPKKALIKGKLLECERGQSLNSLSTWGKIFGNWSTKKVRTFLKNLEIDKMVVVESVGITTRLTVCNYDEYQTGGHAEETQKKRTGHASDTQRTRTGYTNNNGNNGNNENNVNNGNKITTPKNGSSKEFKEAQLIAEYFLGCIVSHKPNFKKPNIDSWSKEIERAIRIDGRTPRELCEVAAWSSRDPFWQSNILSAKKLRSQFDQLQSKMQQPGTQTMEQHGKAWLSLADDNDE